MVTDCPVIPRVENGKSKVPLIQNGKDCGEKIAVTTLNPVNYCPLCGEVADRCPSRNYIIGADPALDKHLLRNAMFAEAKL